ncbi:T9SS type A sorting domain-containing protein [Cochleicola gelatinilyticus]|uniref:Secretion system C-terminal sorting domain-containing protein n=1 Tax=Cochleicola gelatinilyticus TaxID=1763537 RepID=A0A167H3Y3_9FLAO|nr:T9SS type A sorting domain-containing protein [Cochleicola gelatinilyticus]OAB78190.1 hypothetical protein ULVI_11975 [Cochleicola gelatinilyticus]
MKTILSIIFLSSTIFLYGQETFDLDWEQGVMGGDASFTIAIGDAIHWTWANGSSHSVTSLEESNEEFDSGILTGTGSEFTYTFTEEGENPYQCDVHPSSMFGTITVEVILDIEEKFKKNVLMYPNPIEDAITIVSLHKLEAYEIFDVYGKRVGWGEGGGTLTMLNTSYLNSGVYFITVQSKEYKTTKKLIKK